jgi:hypothetical protein
MITISGLTARQKTLMDLLWSCTTMEQAQQLIRALPNPKDAADARSLIVIAMQESLEEEGALAQWEEAAHDAINSCR